MGGLGPLMNGPFTTVASSFQSEMLGLVRLPNATMSGYSSNSILVSIMIHWSLRSIHHQGQAEREDSVALVPKS